MVRHMNRARGLAAAGLSLGLMLLAGCSTAEVDGNYYNPRDYEVVTEDKAPSQEEIDRSFEEDLAEIESEMGPDSSGGTTCVDVTSYDYNWDNDVKCTRPDGSVFFTSYEGAARHRRNR